MKGEQAWLCSWRVSRMGFTCARTVMGTWMGKYQLGIQHSLQVEGWLAVSLHDALVCKR